MLEVRKPHPPRPRRRAPRPPTTRSWRSGRSSLASSRSHYSPGFRPLSRVIDHDPERLTRTRGADCRCCPVSSVENGQVHRDRLARNVTPDEGELWDPLYSSDRLHRLEDLVSPPGAASRESRRAFGRPPACKRCCSTFLAGRFPFPPEALHRPDVYTAARSRCLRLAQSRQGSDP